MKLSIVTISFNQAEFLERTILSVIGQKGVDFEYIIVDPGSTDGSREIIERHRPHFSHVLLDKDNGPADGLNKGFALATGEIYAYLNSDDMFEPDALARAAKYLDQHPDVDVACGHAWVTDLHDNRLRRVWSEPYERLSVAYGASVQIQPSTFIRREAFLRTAGFNVENRSNWDGELLIDLYLSGAKIGLIDETLSCYRLHSVSITNSGKLDAAIQLYGGRAFEKLMGRSGVPSDRLFAGWLRLRKHFRSPKATLERVLRGALYRRQA